MLTIGNIQLDAPMIQAALSGYSDLAMRVLAREFSCPYTLNEVVLDKMIAVGGKKMRRMLAVAENEHPVGCQLMGDAPEQFAIAANEAVALGYDAVDINFGCPVKKVLGRCRGGFLLSTPQAAGEILRSVNDAVDNRVPVTVKMRCGMDDSAESARNFFTILDAAFASGCSAVTIHGRTVEQRYVGPSRWEILRRAKRHIGDRVMIGSGDLFSAEDCIRMLDQTGVDGVSLARGAIGNPFIFHEIRTRLAGRPLPDPPSIAAQRAAVLRHFELMALHHGPQRASVLFRKFGVRYSELHPCHADVKMAYVRVGTPEQLMAMIDQWYGDAGNYPPVVRRSRPEALVAAGATLQP